MRHCNSCSLQTVKVTVELCRTPVLLITNAKHNGSACSTSSGSDYLGIPTDSRNDVRFLLPKEWRTITGQTMSVDGAFPRSRYSDECILHTQCEPFSSYTWRHQESLPLCLPGTTSRNPGRQNGVPGYSRTRRTALCSVQLPATSITSSSAASLTASGYRLSAHVEKGK
jgi:hypothetical protein